MFHRDRKRLLLVAAMLAVAGLAAACESDAERRARLEREAYIKTLNVEELQNSLETVNPDPYAPAETGTRNIGRTKND